MRVYVLLNRGYSFLLKMEVASFSISFSSIFNCVSESVPKSLILVILQFCA